MGEAKDAELAKALEGNATLRQQLADLQARAKEVLIHQPWIASEVPVAEILILCVFSTASCRTEDLWCLFSQILLGSSRHTLVST